MKKPIPALRLLAFARADVLSDPLGTAEGTKITTAAEWREKRRPGLLAFFANISASGRTLLKRGDFPCWNGKTYQNALKFEPPLPRHFLLFTALRKRHAAAEFAL